MVLIVTLHNGVDDLALEDVICFDGVGDVVGHSLVSGDHSSPRSIFIRNLVCISVLLFAINSRPCQGFRQLSGSLCGFSVCHIHLPNDLVIHMGNRFISIEEGVINLVRLLRNAQIRSLVRILDGERFFFRYIYRCTAFSGSILNSSYTVFDCNRQGIRIGVILHPRNRTGRIFLNGVGIGSCGQAQGAVSIKDKGSSVSISILCPSLQFTHSNFTRNGLGGCHNLAVYFLWLHRYSERRVVRQRANVL